MTYRCYGKPFETADLATPPTMFQKFTLDALEGNQVLKAIVAGLLIHNTDLTGYLQARLFADSAGSPGALIANSTTQKDLASLRPSAGSPYVLGWYNWEFPETALRAGASYHIGFRVVGSYSYSDAQHIAWLRSFPDPQYRDGITLEVTKLLSHPFDLGIITGRL